MHFAETQLEAAKRKLREECGLEAIAVEELATFDVLLDEDEFNIYVHGIMTLYHFLVRTDGQLRLDAQSLKAEWHLPEKWQAEVLHPFIRSNLERNYDRNHSSG